MFLDCLFYIAFRAVSETGEDFALLRYQSNGMSIIRLSGLYSLKAGLTASPFNILTQNIMGELDPIGLVAEVA